MISIKLSMNGVVRRAALNEGGINFQEVENVARRLYPELANQETISLSWIDNEGDNIILSSEEEFKEAVRVMIKVASHIRNNNQCLRFSVIASHHKEGGSQESFPASNEFKMRHFATCDECHVYPIIGIRYKCTTREDFDLYSNCEAKRKQPFPMIKIYDASQKWMKGSSRYQQKDFDCKSTSKPFPRERQCEFDECIAGVLPEIISIVLDHLADLDSAESLRKEQSVPCTGIQHQELVENILKAFSTTCSSETDPHPAFIVETINSVISSLFPTGQGAINVNEGRKEACATCYTSTENATCNTSGITSNHPDTKGTTSYGGPTTCSAECSDTISSNATATATPLLGLTDSDIWQSELQMLAEMGFFNRDEIIPLLRRFAYPPLSQRRQQLQDSHGSPDAALINMNGIHRVVNELFSR